MMSSHVSPDDGHAPTHTHTHTRTEVRKPLTRRRASAPTPQARTPQDPPQPQDGKSRHRTGRKGQAHGRWERGGGKGTWQTLANVPGGRDCRSFRAFSESFTVNVYRYCPHHARAMTTTSAIMHQESGHHRLRHPYRRRGEVSMQGAAVPALPSTPVPPPHTHARVPRSAHHHGCQRLHNSEH